MRCKVRVVATPESGQSPGAAVSLSTPIPKSRAWVSETGSGWDENSSATYAVSLGKLA